MLCLGLKKSLSSPRLELMAQGMAECIDDQSKVWYHSAIQAPKWTTHIHFVVGIRWGNFKGQCDQILNNFATLWKDLSLFAKIVFGTILNLLWPISIALIKFYLLYLMAKIELTIWQSGHGIGTHFSVDSDHFSWIYFRLLKSTEQNENWNMLTRFVRARSQCKFTM